MTTEPPNDLQHLVGKYKPAAGDSNPFRQRIRERLARMGGKHRAPIGIRCHLDPREEFEVERLAIIAHRQAGLAEPMLK